MKLPETRIKTVTDGNDCKRFYPQYKRFWLWWPIKDSRQRPECTDQHDRAEWIIKSFLRDKKIELGRRYKKVTYENFPQK